MVLLLLVGCNGMRALLSPFDTPEGPAYRAITEEWTREGVLYRGVETLLQARGVLKSMEWRTAYAARAKELYALTPEEHSALLDELKDAEEGALEIILALSSQDPVHTNLLRTQTWSLFFDSGQQKLYPVSLERLDWPREKLRAFFSFYSPWQEYYLLTFPRPVIPGGSLVIAGPGGQIDLSWNSF
jgi:hypothetical protein